MREEINPRDSWRASKAFRLQIGGEIAKRALKESVRRGMVAGVVISDHGAGTAENAQVLPGNENETGGELS